MNYLDVVYALAAGAASPIVAYKYATGGKRWRTATRERFGIVPKRDDRPVVFHAASVGEVNLAQPLIGKFRSAVPDRAVHITTNTDTGRRRAQTLFPQIPVTFLPLDFSANIRRFMAAIEPSGLVLVELELWPNLIAAAKKLGIPVAVTNGRISDRAFPRYRALKPFLRHVFSAVDLFLMQNDTYARRVLELGAVETGVYVTGQIKYDQTPDAAPNEKIRKLLPTDAPTLVLAAIHPGEEAPLLDAWQKSNAASPVNLVLVPRHIEKTPYFQNELQKRAIDHVVYSQIGQSPTSARVVLVDVIGVLTGCYRLANVVFVGGSLIPHGGQNMLEPMSAGVATIWGPHVFNFRDEADDAVKAGAGLMCDTPDQAQQTIGRLVKFKSERNGLAECAAQFIRTKKGATDKTVDFLRQLF